MSFDAAAALRQAGILGGTMAPELEEFFSGLTKEETETLISLKNRISAVVPDVVAHSQDWNKPEATQEGFDAAMLCMCGAWSGAGQK